MAYKMDLSKELLKDIKWNLEFCKENDLKPKNLIVPEVYKLVFEKSEVLQKVVSELNIPVVYRKNEFIIDMEYDYANK